MKGKKYRYDESKLKKSSSLKKQIALILATEKAMQPNYSLNLSETLAFGLKERPFISYHEKELIKQIDELNVKYHENLENANKELAEVKYQTDRYTWSAKANIKKWEDKIAELKPIIDELIEDAFSE